MAPYRNKEFILPVPEGDPGLVLQCSLSLSGSIPMYPSFCLAAFSLGPATSRLHCQHPPVQFLPLPSSSLGEERMCGIFCLLDRFYYTPKSSLYTNTAREQKPGTRKYLFNTKKVESKE